MSINLLKKLHFDTKLSPCEEKVCYNNDGITKSAEKGVI